MLSQRWKMVFWLVLIVLISYFDRVNFSVSAPIILKEFALTPSQLGLVMSAFTVGYMILNFPAGFLIERYTATKILFVIVLLWSIMTFLTALMWSFITLLIVRLIFGMFEGPLLPSNTKMVNMWVLPKERATASGLWLAAIPLGVVLGNISSSFVVSQYGWRSVFYIFGVIGIVIAFAGLKILKNRPEDDPNISKAELEQIQKAIKEREGEMSLMSAGHTLKQLGGIPEVWMLCIMYFAFAMVFWGNINWLPTYFVKARGSDILKAGLLSSTPWIGAVVGGVVIGKLSDRFHHHTRSSWLAVIQYLMVPATAYAVMAPSITLCLISFTITSFLCFGTVTLLYAAAMDIFDRADVAKVSGLMLAAGSFGGIIAPSLIGYVLQYTNSFNLAYYIFAGVSFIGGTVSWMLVKKESVIRASKVTARVSA